MGKHGAIRSRAGSLAITTPAVAAHAPSHTQSLRRGETTMDFLFCGTRLTGSLLREPSSSKTRGENQNFRNLAIFKAKRAEWTAGPPLGPHWRSRDRISDLLQNQALECLRFDRLAICAKWRIAA